MRRLLTLSGSELAALVSGREISSREAVEAHIDHLVRLNPALNAAVEMRFEQALDEADQADARLAAGDDDLPPFHGVPCTIKESFGLTGMRQTSGLYARRHVRAHQDATTVARMRAAGAIPIATSNVSELCMWMESANAVYGRSNNPYDTTRIVGGSSGGEGALVGAGASPFGLGSDIGGSIRMPAFFNGVFGHKGTGGLVPATGQFPMAENDALRYLSTGPITRRARDLMPLLQIMAGPDGRDPACREITLRDPAEVDLSGLRVLNVTTNGFVRVQRELVDAQNRAARALEARGATVEETRIEGFERSLELWSAMLEAASDTSFASQMGQGVEVAGGKELLRWALGRSNHTLPAIGLAILEKLNKASPKRIERLVQEGRQVRDRLARRLGTDGVLLYPSYASTAPRHGEPLWLPWKWAYTAVLNVMEIPVTQVPLGLDSRGLPLGVQVGAAHEQDHLTIAVALALEEDFGGWVPPPRVFGEEKIHHPVQHSPQNPT